MRDIVGKHLVAPSFDELMVDLLMDLNNPDFVCSPRGSEVKEVILPRLVLTNPRARLISAKSRDPNYGFAVGEFLWYWRGSNNLSEMLYYNKRMDGFSDDYKTLNSAYGYILKGMGRYDTCFLDDLPKHPNMGMLIDQWSMTKNTLLNDSDSRRAVMQICHPIHNYVATHDGSKDVPCTLSLQFFIRKNRLHMHAHMRSNDVMWGLTYDLFSFTLFQECMLLELRKQPKFADLELGRYFHTAGSMHLYERHYDMAEKMIDEYGSRDIGWVSKVEAMSSLAGIHEVDRLVTYEKSLRTGEVDPTETVDGIESDSARWMLRMLNDNRRKRDKKR